MPDLCAHCGAGFGSAAELLRHARKAHPESIGATAGASPPGVPSGVVCAQCGEWFPGPRELLEHGLRPHVRSNRPAGRPASG